MITPKYTPEEILERSKLMMEYDLSKNLDENKKSLLNEQTVDKFNFPVCVRTEGNLITNVDKPYIQGNEFLDREGFKFFTDNTGVNANGSPFTYSCKGRTSRDVNIEYKSTSTSQTQSGGKTQSGAKPQTQPQKQTTSRSQLYTIPKDLDGTEEGVKKFQGWLFYKGFGNELGNYGVDGKYGKLTATALIKHREDYLRDIGKKQTQPAKTDNKNTTTTIKKQKRPDKESFGTGKNSNLNISSSGGVESAYLQDDTY